MICKENVLLLFKNQREIGASRVQEGPRSGHVREGQESMFKIEGHLLEVCVKKI